MISRFSPCRQTYMGNETIMRRLLGEYGIKMRGYRQGLIALACKVAWCHHLVTVKLLVGLIGHQKPPVYTPLPPQFPFKLDLTRVALSCTWLDEPCFLWPAFPCPYSFWGKKKSDQLIIDIKIWSDKSYWLRRHSL